MADSRQQLNVKLEPELYDQIKQASERDERSVAQTVRYALRRYLAEQRLAS